MPSHSRFERNSWNDLLLGTTLELLTAVQNATQPAGFMAKWVEQNEELFISSILDLWRETVDENFKRYASHLRMVDILLLLRSYYFSGLSVKQQLCLLEAIYTQTSRFGGTPLAARLFQYSIQARNEGCRVLAVQILSKLDPVLEQHWSDSDFHLNFVPPKLVEPAAPSEEIKPLFISFYTFPRLRLLFHFC